MLTALTVAAAVYAVVANFPRGLILAALLIGAALAAWYGLLRRGISRVAGLGSAAALVLAAVVIVVLDSGVPELVLVGTGAFAAIAATKAAFAVGVPLPGAPDPERPVLFFNPRSGGGTRTANAALVAAIAANAPVPTKTNSGKPESSTTLTTAASTSAAAEPSPATRETPRRSRPYQAASVAPISNAARIRPRGKFATTA